MDDLVQETFLAAWANLNNFRGDSGLRHWLLGIARHKVEEYYRARLREAGLAPDETGEDGYQPPVVPIELDVELDRKRTWERTREVLSDLPESYATALLWRYWEQRSTRDIALAAGKTEKAVERLLARAREQFRRRWTERVNH